MAAGKRWVIRLDLPLTLVTSSDAAAAGANTSNSDYRHLQVQNKQIEVNYSSSGSIAAAGLQVFHLDPSLDLLVTPMYISIKVYISIYVTANMDNQLV